MYKLEFLPIAKKDIENIIYYISNNLKNKTAAINLSNNFIKAVNNIVEFPYGSPEYKIFTKLKYVYRKIKIKNFLMFYTINEENKTIIVVRILYSKMNINNILE